MLILLRTLSGIVLLRLGPDALPRSGFLVALTFLAMSAVSFLGLALSGGYQPWSVGFFGLSLGLSLGTYTVALRMRGFADRLLQTFAALFGASVIIGVIEIPLLATGSLGDESQARVLLLLLLIAWSILVDGHILSRALEVPLIGGTLLALSVFAAQMFLYQQFPAS